MSYHIPDLESIYRALPRTACQRCGSCCSLWAGMYFVEYRAVASCIETCWAPSRLNAFRQRIRRNYRYRRMGLEYYDELPIRISSGHCIFYDAENSACSIYSHRPLACRAFGLNGECRRLRIIGEASDASSIQELVYEVTRELVDRNIPFRDGDTRRLVETREVRPVEFWFSLQEIGWDPTMDQTDPRYLRTLIGRPASYATGRSPSMRC